LGAGRCGGRLGRGRRSGRWGLRRWGGRLGRLFGRARFVCGARGAAGGRLLGGRRRCGLRWFRRLLGRLALGLAVSYGGGWLCGGAGLGVLLASRGGWRVRGLRAFFLVTRVGRRGCVLLDLTCLRRRLCRTRRPGCSAFVLRQLLLGNRRLCRRSGCFAAEKWQRSETEERHDRCYSVAVPTTCRGAAKLRRASPGLPHNSISSPSRHAKHSKSLPQSASCCRHLQTCSSKSSSVRSGSWWNSPSRFTPASRASEVADW